MCFVLEFWGTKIEHSNIYVCVLHLQYTYIYTWTWWDGVFYGSLFCDRREKRLTIYNSTERFDGSQQCKTIMIIAGNHSVIRAYAHRRIRERVHRLTRYAWCTTLTANTIIVSSDQNRTQTRKKMHDATSFHLGCCCASDIEHVILNVRDVSNSRAFRLLSTFLLVI